MADDFIDRLKKLPDEIAQFKVAALGGDQPKPALFGSLPYLSELHVAEPCAGTGNLFRVFPPDRRRACDIYPQDGGELGIEQADYQTIVLDPSYFWIVISNPAFSKGGPVKLFQWAATQPCVCAIGLIVPHFFDRPSTLNRLDRSFHRILRHELHPESFTHHGQRAWSPAVYQLWVRRNDRRPDVVVREDHPDFAWLRSADRQEADCWIQNWGVGRGDIKPLDALGRTNIPDQHFFVRERRPGSIDRLKTLNLREAGYPSLSSPRLYRDQIIAAYIAAYGDPDAPDYTPEIVVPLAPVASVVAPEPVVAVETPEPVAQQPPSATEPPAAKPVEAPEIVAPREALVTPSVAPKRRGRPARPKPEWFTIRQVNEDGRLWWRVFDSFGPTKCDRQFTKHDAMKAGMRLKVPFREEGKV